MAEIPAFMLRHKAKVETITTGGMYGDSYVYPVTIRCRVQSKSRKVTDPDTGAEVVASGTIYTRRMYEDTCTPGSRVTLPNGRTAYVLDVIAHDDSGQGGWEHIEVILR